jgi:hypothetical protein
MNRYRVKSCLGLILGLLAVPCFSEQNKMLFYSDRRSVSLLNMPVHERMVPISPPSPFALLSVVILDRYSITAAATQIVKDGGDSSSADRSEVSASVRFTEGMVCP